MIYLANYTSVFTLQQEMQNAGFEAATPAFESTKVYTDEQILDELNKLLLCINTLDDYEELINIIDKLRAIFSMRFLYIFFKALVQVEKRIWNAAGMPLPIDRIMDTHIDLLLEKYTDFAYNLEKDIVAWTKENGFFDKPEYYSFIKRRNTIYARYIVIAGEIMEC